MSMMVHGASLLIIIITGSIASELVANLFVGTGPAIRVKIVRPVLLIVVRVPEGIE